MLPLEHVGAETVISESFRWVEEGVLGKFEMHEVGIGGRSIFRSRHFVWVVEGGTKRTIRWPGNLGRELLGSLQSSKARLDSSVIHIVRQPKGLIEVTPSSQIIICFEYSVEKVCENDRDENAPPMFLVSRCARLRFRVASPYDDAVIDGLNPSSRKL